MFEAGSAVYTLSGRVIDEPFRRYGALVDRAEARKAHEVQLGAKTSPVGFERFNAYLDGVQANMRRTVAEVGGSWDRVVAATNRMAAATDRDLGSVRKALGATTESYVKVGTSARDSGLLVVEADARMAKSAEERAAAEKAAADETIRANERMAASAAGGGGGRGYRNPVVAAGGGGGPAAQAEQQSKSITSSYAKGFNTLANLGKWATVGILAVGGVSVKVASDFEKQMELVRTQAGYTQKDVDALKKHVLDLAPAVGIGPSKLAEGLFHIASAGIPASKAMEVLKIAAEGAKVGNADLEHVTNALVGIMNTAPKDIHGVAEAMGVLNDIVGRGNLRMEDLTAAMGTGILVTAKALGLGLRDVGAALDVMTSRGIPAQQGANRLRTALALIEQPTTKSQKALDQLGFSHDRLAEDFRKKGLIGALQDLQGALDNTFKGGRKLTLDEERKALMDYGKALADSGVTGKAAEKDLAAFKKQLDANGDGAIHASQLIIQAFGGARMGTTMLTLMQNIDDVKKHTDELNQADAAGRFQKAWEATKKTFAQQAASLGASVLVLADKLGQFLIPKLEDTVKWLINAAKWLGRHKDLAEALAYAFGTLLVAAIAAFFARFIAKTAEGLASIGRFAAGITELPAVMERASVKVAGKFAQWQAQINKTTDDYLALTDAASQAGDSMVGAGGAAGGRPATGALGPLEGMINGIMGTINPGSEENPLCVTIVGRPSAVSGEKAAKDIETAEVEGGKKAGAEVEGGMVAGGKKASAELGAGEVAGGKLAGGELATAEAGGGLLGGLGGRARGAAGAAAGAGAAASRGLGSIIGRVGNAAIGTLLAQTIGAALPGQIGKAIKDVGTGAAIGSIFGPWGIALGGALGGAVDLFIRHHGKTDGEKWAEQFTASLPGHISKGVEKGLAQSSDKTASAARDASAEANRQRLIRSGNQLLGGTPRLSAATSTAAFDREFNALYTAASAAGKKAGDAFTGSMSKVTHFTPEILTRDITTALKDVPKGVSKGGPVAVQAWRDSAFKQMIAFASSLEQHGKLPKHSVDNMIASVESVFPHLVDYLNQEGLNSASAIAKHLKLDEALKNLKTAVSNMRDQWGDMAISAKITNANLNKNTAQALSDLRLLMKSKNKQIREEATAEYNHMESQINGTWKKMASATQASIDKMHALIASGTSHAATDAETNLKKFTTSVDNAMAGGVLSTSEGMKLIAQTADTVIKAFGGQTIPIPALVHAQTLQQLYTQGKTGISGVLTGNAGGGVLPGKEFGYQDNMLLVDPMGRPRAKMAGDEAVFTRHQQPYVDMGLRAIGFGGMNDLWNKVTRQHGYASGGQLPGFAAGGHWVRTGATIDPTSGQAPTYSAHGGMSFAELLEAGANAGMRPDLTQLLGLPRGSFGAPMETAIDIRMPGSRRSFQIWKNDVGSGQSGNAHYTIDLHQAIANALGWHPNQDVEAAVVGTDPNAIVTSAGASSSGASSWTPLKVPGVKGKGFVSDLVRGALKTATDAANKYGQSQMPAITGGVGGAAGTFSGTVAGTKAMPSGYFFPFPKGMNFSWQRIDQGQDLEESPGAPVVAIAPGIVSRTSDSFSGFGPYYATEQITGGPLSGRGVYYGHTKVVKTGPVQAGDVIAVTQSAANTWTAAPAGWLELGFLPYGSMTAGNAIAPILHAIASGHYAQGGHLDQSLLGSHKLGPESPLKRAFHDIVRIGDPPAEFRRKERGITNFGGGGLLNFAAGGNLPSFAKGGKKPKPTAPPHVTPPFHLSPPPKKKKPPKKHLPKNSPRKHQPLSQTTAQVLNSLGLGSFVDDQNLLGRLDAQYDTQNTIYSSYDTGPDGGLSTADLDVLMGIREHEWDILYKEFRTLPAAIDKLGGMVNALQGHPASAGHHPDARIDAWVSGQGDARPGAPLSTSGFGGNSGAPTGASGIYKLQGEVLGTENEIKHLKSELTLDSRQSQTIRHNVTAKALSLANDYASQYVGYLDQLNQITDQRNGIAAQRIVNRQKILALTQQKAAKKSGKTTLTLSQIVDQVMAGATGASTGGGSSSATKGTDPQTKALRSQVLDLVRQELSLAERAQGIRRRMQSATLARQAAARQLRKEGFDAAWSITLGKWRIQDKITALEDKLAKLKAKLKQEQGQLKAEQDALTQMNTWLTGGLEGNTAISDSLTSEGLNILDLYRQGADLPTAGRSGPTKELIETVLRGLGLQVPDVTRPAAPVADIPLLTNQEQATLDNLGYMEAIIQDRPVAQQTGDLTAVYTAIANLWKQRIGELTAMGAPVSLLTEAQSALNDANNNLQTLTGVNPDTGATTGATSPADIAAAAYAEFQAFQADRASLFGQFGSNYVPIGANPYGSVTAQAAGNQYYGATYGAARGGFATPVPGGYGGAASPRGGGTEYNVEVTNHFGSGPPDAHSWAARQKFELGAMFR